MIYLDNDALNAKFWATALTYKNEAGTSVALTENQKLVENGPTSELDETQPWVRWTINPGQSAAVTTKPVIYKSVGTATLQIFVPKGKGTGIATDIAEDFENAFRSYKSTDRCLNVSRTQRDKGNDKDYYQVNVSVIYNSTRPA